MTADRFLPTHVRCVETGAVYAVVGLASLLTDMVWEGNDKVLVLQGEKASLICVHPDELTDGQFEIALPPSAEVEPTTGGTSVVVVRWAWTEQPLEGRTFWGAYKPGPDGRVSGWPKAGMKPLGAATVTVVDGVGLNLLHTTQAPC